MYLLQDLSAQTLHQCNAGDIYVGAQRAIGAVGLVAELHGEKGTIGFCAPGDGGFQLHARGDSTTKLLTIRNTWIEVDEASITSPYKGDYEPGMIALHGQTLMVICTSRFATMAVSLDGATASDPSADFMFKHWRVMAGPKDCPTQVYSTQD